MSLNFLFVLYIGFIFRFITGIHFAHLGVEPDFSDFVKAKMRECFE